MEAAVEVALQLAVGEAQQAGSSERSQQLCARLKQLLMYSQPIWCCCWTQRQYYSTALLLSQHL